jgi:hypothetical protein
MAAIKRAWSAAGSAPSIAATLSCERRIGLADLGANDIKQVAACNGARTLGDHEVILDR